MNKETKKTTIGGQALIEGVMMKGVKSASMAVRQSDGTIDVQTWQLSPEKWYNKVPVVRGSAGIIINMVMGYRCLVKSAKLSGMMEIEEKSKFEIWMEKRASDSFTNLIVGVSGVLGILLSFGLFYV